MSWKYEYMHLCRIYIQQFSFSMTQCMHLKCYQKLLKSLLIPIYTPANSEQKFLLLHFLPKFMLSDLNFLPNVGLIVICMSLMITEIEHISLCLLAVWIFFFCNMPYFLLCDSILKWRHVSYFCLVFCSFMFVKRYSILDYISCMYFRLTFFLL